MERKKRILRRGWFSGCVSYLYLTILAVIAVFPLAWVLLSSVKSKSDLASDPLALIPKVFTAENYRIVFEQMNFGNNVLNSIFIAGGTTLIAIAISCLGAYGIVRYCPRIGKAITRVLITTYMFPPILLAVPYSIIMGKMLYVYLLVWPDGGVSFVLGSLCNLAAGGLFQDCAAGN